MRTAASLFIISALAASALATEQPAQGTRGPVWEACKADVASLCPGIQPGGGRIKECLKTNRDKLSDGCKSAIAAARQARRDAKASSVPPAPAQPASPSAP